MAHLGQIEQAKAESERLGELENVMRKAGEDLFARNIRMLHLELDSWLEHVAGRENASIALMEEAVTLEESTPKHAVTPGPTLPARELLGDLLSEQKHPRRALDAYQKSLLLYPNRFNSLLGASRAARDSGDKALSSKYYAQLLRTARGGKRHISL